MATATKYLFKGIDTETITRLGYRFDGITQKAFAGFMRKNYPGFDLASLLQQVERLMVPHAVAPVTRLITVNDTNLHLELYNEYTGEDDALIFDRVFSREKQKVVVSHEYLVFPLAARNQGLSKRVLRASLQQYKQMGVNEVKVVAGLSAGAYVWARHGFVAVNQAEMSSILEIAKARLQTDQYKVVKAIYDHYYTNRPGGNSFPIRQWADLPFMKPVLMGSQSQWEGRLDLKNKQQLSKFENYVSQ